VAGAAPSHAAKPPGGAALLIQGEIMAEPRDEQILNRAYQIWEQNGKPDGREDEFWK
jgi:hypothetical protein